MRPTFEVVTKDEFTSHILPLKQKLYRLAYTMLSSADDAKDVVQDVFVKVWDQAASLDKIKNIEAYCMRMTRNRALDLMKRKGYRYQSIDERWDMESKAPGPVEQVHQKEDVRLVREAIASLEPRSQQVIHLRDIEGHPYRDISELLDLKESHVRVLLHRARLQVKHYIESKLGHESHPHA